MSDRWVLSYDPREGEVEPAEWCSRHGQRAESCGPCFDEARDDEEHEFWQRSTPEDDEQMGAAMSARFQKGA
jgi:hypothetical protein